MTYSSTRLACYEVTFTSMEIIVWRSMPVTQNWLKKYLLITRSKKRKQVDNQARLQ